MHINNKHTKPNNKHKNQTKTKLSPQRSQWSHHSIVGMRRRGGCPL